MISILFQILSESPMKPVRSGSAKAKFNFTGKDPKQLTIKKGDTVELLERVDKNWYFSVLCNI